MKTPSFIYNRLQGLGLTDRRTFIFDLLAALQFGVFQGLAVSFIPFVGRTIGLDSAMLAILSVSGFVGLFLNLWIGHRSDTGNKPKWVLWPGLISRGLITCSFLAISPALFLGVMCIFNIVSTFGGPAYMGIMRATYSDRRRGELMGYIRIAIQLTTVLSSVFAGWAMQGSPDAWKIIFAIAGLFGIGSSIVFYKVKPRRQAVIEGAAPAIVLGFRASLHLLVKDRLFMVFMIIAFINGFPDKLVVALETIRYKDELGMNYFTSGLLQTALPVFGALVGYLILAKLSHKISPFLLLLGAVVCTAARLFNVAVAADSLHLIPGVFLNGIGLSAWDLAPMFAIMLFVGRDRFSLYFGLYNALVGVRGIIGPIIGNWLYSGLGMSISSIYFMGFILELFGAVLTLGFYLYYRNHRHRHREHIDASV